MASEPDGTSDRPDVRDLDVSSVTTFGEFAVLLRSLRVRYGEPSLRDLEKRSIAMATDRRKIILSRTAMSDVLKGARPASHDFLVSFLDALGMPVGDQQSWLVARTKIAESRLAMDQATDGQGEYPADTQAAQALSVLSEPTGARAGAVTAGPSQVAISLRHRRRKAIMWFGGGVAVVGMGAAFFILSPDPVTSTMNCLSGCTGSAPELTLHGHLSGDLPSNKKLVLMTRNDLSDHWYLGPVIVVEDDGDWSMKVTLGNPKPQPRDRKFRICLNMLRSTSIEHLTELMLANADGPGGPSGLRPADLPTDREEFACKEAIRPKNT